MTPYEKFLANKELLSDNELQAALSHLCNVACAARALGMPYHSVQQAAAASWQVLRLMADARGLSYERFA